MSARTALNKDLIMRRVSGRRHQVHNATKSTTSTTDSDTNVHFPHESDVQTSSAVFSDVFARVESGFNHFRTVTHDHNARLAAISAVDKEVDATRQLLLSLLTRRNALAPISLLPPEILARVFHLLALDEPPNGIKPTLGWIRTTHVCRHWRQVALDDSSLWARIPCIDSGLDTALISEMLTRSRNAPLEIDISIMRAIPNPMHMFPPHLSHTRALRLYGLEGSDFEGVREIFSREAPALLHFELDFAVGYPMIFEDLEPVPETTVILHLSTLRPMVIHSSWQLTQLKIVLQAEMFDEDIPSLGNATLEILVLDLCLPSDLPQSPWGRTVHLPRLSRFTTLHLRCISNIGSPDNDYHILPVVSAQFQTSVPVEFKSLKVTLNHTRIPSSRDIEVDMDGEAKFVLSFDGLAEIAHWKEILERACKMLPISNLEFLSISTPNTVGSIDWAEHFKRCTNVTTIQAIGRGTSGFIRALTPPSTKNLKKGKRKKRDDSGTSAIRAPGPIIFPNLTSLSLENLDFTEIKSRSGVLYEVFVNGLRQRKSTYNVPIRKLRVDHCVFPAKRANNLEKLVKDFHWDGEEGSIDTFDEFEDFDEDYESDFIEPGARWEDFFVGSTQAEWEWWDNYSDGY
ncbi:hypothetical protein BGY98DRAFT_934577 [Russula aff. rugulosa BPL654]|nr:hypothetical protein BGY98DRAFT_934577 [Russula aff. rugulosa BPL654]